MERGAGPPQGGRKLAKPSQESGSVTAKVVAKSPLGWLAQLPGPASDYGGATELGRPFGLLRRVETDRPVTLGRAVQLHVTCTVPEAAAAAEVAARLHCAARIFAKEMERIQKRTGRGAHFETPPPVPPSSGPHGIAIQLVPGVTPDLLLSGFEGTLPSPSGTTGPTFSTTELTARMAWIEEAARALTLPQLEARLKRLLRPGERPASASARLCGVVPLRRLCANDATPQPGEKSPLEQQLDEALARQDPSRPRRAVVLLAHAAAQKEVPTRLAAQRLITLLAAQTVPLRPDDAATAAAAAAAGGEAEAEGEEEVAMRWPTLDIGRETDARVVLAVTGLTKATFKKATSWLVNGGRVMIDRQSVTLVPRSERTQRGKGKKKQKGRATADAAGSLEALSTLTTKERKLALKAQEFRRQQRENQLQASLQAYAELGGVDPLAPGAGEHDLDATAMAARGLLQGPPGSGRGVLRGADGRRRRHLRPGEQTSAWEARHEQLRGGSVEEVGHPAEGGAVPPDRNPSMVPQGQVGRSRFGSAAGRMPPEAAYLSSTGPGAASSRIGMVEPATLDRLAAGLLAGELPATPEEAEAILGEAANDAAVLGDTTGTIHDRAFTAKDRKEIRVRRAEALSRPLDDGPRTLAEDERRARHRRRVQQMKAGEPLSDDEEGLGAGPVLVEVDDETGLPTNEPAQPVAEAFGDGRGGLEDLGGEEFADSFEGGGREDDEDDCDDAAVPFDPPRALTNADLFPDMDPQLARRRRQQAAAGAATAAGTAGEQAVEAAGAALRRTEARELGRMRRDRRGHAAPAGVVLDEEGLQDLEGDPGEDSDDEWAELADTVGGRGRPSLRRGQAGGPGRAEQAAAFADQEEAALQEQHAAWLAKADDELLAELALFGQNAARQAGRRRSGASLPREGEDRDLQFFRRTLGKALVDEGGYHDVEDGPGGGVDYKEVRSSMSMLSSGQKRLLARHAGKERAERTKLERQLAKLRPSEAQAKVEAAEARGGRRRRTVRGLLADR